MPSEKSSLSVEITGGIWILFAIFLSIGIPYFSVIITSLIKLRGYEMTADNYTFEHYIALLTESV